MVICLVPGTALPVNTLRPPLIRLFCPSSPTNNRGIVHTRLIATLSPWVFRKFFYRCLVISAISVGPAMPLSSPFKSAHRDTHDTIWYLVARPDHRFARRPVPPGPSASPLLATRLAFTHPLTSRLASQRLSPLDTVCAIDTNYHHRCRLYRAPVESDVKTKVPKDPPTRARSTIRRTARRAVNDPASTPSARFYHRRHGRDPSDEQRQWERMQLPNVASLPFTTTRVPPHQPPRTGLRRATTLHDTTAGAQDAPGPPPLPTDPALRDAILRNGRREIAAQNDRHQQEMARYFGEHMAMLHAATSARPLADTPSEGDETEPIRDRWASASRDRPTPPRQVSESSTEQIHHGNQGTPSVPKSTPLRNLAESAEQPAYG